MERCKGVLLVVLLVCTFSQSNAKDRDDWKEGVAVLTTKEVINAEMILNQQYNVLQLREYDKIRSIPASKIEKVTIFDEEKNLLRRFVVLARDDKNYKAHSFYELIVRGEIQLLARNKEYKLTGEQTVNSFFEKITPAQQRVMKNQDYFFYDGKNLIGLSKFRKKVLPAFNKYFKEEISQYIRQERLNINMPNDQVKIMKYFNKLYNQKLIFAKE